MKIQLPDGQKKILDENISLSQKMKVVNQMVDEWNPLIENNWDSFSIKIFLDSLANYLVWHKQARFSGKFKMQRKASKYVRYTLSRMEEGLAEKGQEDKYILSRKKMEMLVRYKKTSKTTNFSDLNDSESEILFGERGLV